MKKKNLQIYYFLGVLASSIFVIITTIQNNKYWDTEVFSEFTSSFPNPYIYLTENDVTFLKVAHLPHFVYFYYVFSIFDERIQYILISFLSILMSAVVFQEKVKISNL